MAMTLLVLFIGYAELFQFGHFVIYAITVALHIISITNRTFFNHHNGKSNKLENFISQCACGIRDNKAGMDNPIFKF